eukprot:CAMPEP_0173403738 /NCGR_PEP_ID=MMETSP1356-20130122/57531_1 /TAXON_ID=77927 ORGANISM="Hemiselmis virescens, Strain PCC157" /NCGR_SAMPLE_ID=MMETSP1356 /ASSEMBLY_ACC=CAM_ASM_000847 /LENGTH=70 /DNA_ID=CAMNT_0014364309 /DNA_START=322 /DNA_END=531 /DNA_ORIENTATION=+
MMRLGRQNISYLCAWREISQQARSMSWDMASLSPTRRTYSTLWLMQRHLYASHPPMHTTATALYPAAFTT